MAQNRFHAPFLLLAIVALSAALWAGWIRLGWNWPPIHAALPGAHGPLMVAGFLGTLIGLERTVALRQPWMYSSPLFFGLGALIFILGGPPFAGILFFTMGSLFLVLIFYALLRRHITLFTATMAAGAMVFTFGNLLWLSGWYIPRVVLWWQAFLVLTIAGERLELGRLQRYPRSVYQAFIIAIASLALGLIVAAFTHAWGTRVFGLGLFALAVWFLLNDIARRTIRQQGIPRFAAISLLSGYVWLGIGGLFGVIFGGQAAGPLYDAFLHAVMVGFVLSMIFGHAPIIFPSILGLPIGYNPVFYIPLALLHVSLLMRVTGDLSFGTLLRLWGGLLNGVAVLLFLSIIASTLITTNRKPRPQGI